MTPLLCAFLNQVKEKIGNNSFCCTFGSQQILLSCVTDELKWKLHESRQKSSKTFVGLRCLIIYGVEDAILRLQRVSGSMHRRSKLGITTLQSKTMQVISLPSWIFSMGNICCSKLK
ncbi:uncharacterized protein [Medicago truncatula]|uniref:uncharacterized protein n=1 Tax=Medicago truncatula TaxID=3880 RepID=UPI001967B10A|nr:uncharacterized protein LOC120580853 [Medicago truncatula]